METVVGVFAAMVMGVTGLVVLSMTFKEIVDEDIKIVTGKVKDIYKRLKYRKDIGKEYWKIVEWIETYTNTGLQGLDPKYRGQYRGNMENLNKVVYNGLINDGSGKDNNR